MVSGPMSIEAMGFAGPFVAMLMAGLISMVYSLVLSLGTVTFMADNVIVGTALNMLAPALALLITFMIYGQSSMGLPGSLALSMG